MYRDDASRTVAQRMNRASWLQVLAFLFPSLVFAADGEMGTVRGKIENPGQVTCRGVVSLWSGDDGRIPDPRRYVIIPFSAVSLKSSCEFELQAPAGSYYVGALLRNSPGPDLGPPRQGDQVFMTPDPRDGVLKVEILAGQTVDVGTHRESWRYEGMVAEATLGVSGVVRDTEGQPVAGVLVFAFADVEMTRNPLAVSNRTDLDGRYLLRIDRPGQVYLRVKDNYGGGAPMDGGYIGVFGGATPVSIKLTGDELISGQDINVTKVPVARIQRRRGASPAVQGEK